MADYSELMKLEKKPHPPLSSPKKDTVPVEQTRNPESLKSGKPETLKTRLPENPKAQKYSTQLPPSLIKRIKQHALEQDIKDYEVVQFALEAYLPQKINPEYLKAGKPDSPKPR